jgi:hypothetical protein
MWRNSALRLRFLIFDAWVVVFIFIGLFHWRRWTFETMCAAMLVFGSLGNFGLNPVTLGRWLRSLLTGPVRPAVTHDRRRRLA